MSTVKQQKLNQVAQAGIAEWSLGNWMRFLWERAPPLVFFLLASGPSLSGLYLIEGYIHKEKFAWVLMGELGLLLLVRVMDDVKDYDKDRIVHPERPLPRGLIKVSEVIKVVHGAFLLMLLYSVAMALRFNIEVAFWFTMQVAYTYLMYIEFGCGETLEQSPIIYGLVHQLAIFFGAYFVCALGGVSWTSIRPLLLGAIFFSGFFTYEICRKLDPTLPKLKGTYLVVYGKKPTFIFIVSTIMVGVASSFWIGLHYLLWPMQGIMLASVTALMYVSREPGQVKGGEKPKIHKPVEALSLLYFLIHGWSGYLARFF